jgi:hypothetical protein
LVLLLCEKPIKRSVCITSGYTASIAGGFLPPNPKDTRIGREIKAAAAPQETSSASSRQASSTQGDGSDQHQVETDAELLRL